MRGEGPSYETMHKRSTAKFMGVLAAVGCLVASLSATQPADGKPKKPPAAAKPPPDLRGPRGTCATSADCNSDSKEECVDKKCICDPGKGNARCNAKDDFCTWLGVNANHCGACGHNCGPRASCDESKCVPCKAGETMCPGDASGSVTGWDRECHNLQNEDDNCGKCGRECPSSFFCKNGHCVL